MDLYHISSGDQHLFKINTNDTVCDNVQSINTTTNHPTQWLPWILRMSRPGRPLTKKSIQLQVINPSIVLLKYNVETADQCGRRPTKNLDLNSISCMATSDKDGQAGGGRQELQLFACQRSRHGRRLPPCRRSQVQFNHLWIVFDFDCSFFRDFGDSREGRGQGSVQIRPTAGGNSFCCQMLWIYEIWHSKD